MKVVFSAPSNSLKSLADDAGCGELVSGSEFRVIREKNRQFRGIACLDPKISANLIANSECYRKIPCATEQGIAFARTGNFEQQNREWIGSIGVEAVRTRKSGPCSISSGRLSMSVGKTSKHSGNRRLRTSAMGPTAPELCPLIETCPLVVSTCSSRILKSLRRYGPLPNSRNHRFQ